MTEPTTEPLRVVPSGLFRRDIKRLRKRGVALDGLRGVLGLLAERQPLPTALRDHALVGNYRGYRECHVAPDLLLIYRVVETKLILVAFRAGSHSDLF